MKVLRVWALAIAAAVGFASRAEAAPITIDVAEITWTLEGDFCTSATPEECSSVFTLIYLWTTGGNPAPAPAPIVSASLDVDGTPVDFTPLGWDVSAASPVNSVSLLLFGIPGVPSTAGATISFAFSGARVIGPQMLTPPSALFNTDGSVSLLGIATAFSFEYDATPAPVPEPATLALLSGGLLLAAGRRHRSRRSTR